jgi:hypothetical protein
MVEFGVFREKVSGMPLVQSVREAPDLEAYPPLYPLPFFVNDDSTGLRFSYKLFRINTCELFLQVLIVKGL